MVGRFVDFGWLVLKVANLKENTDIGWLLAAQEVDCFVVFKSWQPEEKYAVLVVWLAG